MAQKNSKKVDRNASNMLTDSNPTKTVKPGPDLAQRESVRVDAKTVIFVPKGTSELEKRRIVEKKLSHLKDLKNATNSLPRKFY